MKKKMNNEIDRLLDLQIEATQISIYCDIIKNLLLKSRSMSIIKVLSISFIVKKRQYLKGSIYRGNNRTDLVLKLLSQASGLFDDMCDQMPYIFQAVDLLVKNGICEVHKGEIIYIAANHQKAVDYDVFTEAAIQESKSYTDRQFLREVISVV